MQKLDRNWTDLLQELRVLQTGIQILTGFLLTLPFQQRFTTLTPLQTWLYLALVVLSVLVTAVLMSTVVMHRSYFQLRIKQDLVRNSDLLLRWTLLLVGLILLGTVGLVFDLVLGGWAAAVSAVLAAAVLAGLWIVLPLTSRRRALRRGEQGDAGDTRAPG
ncbi:sodium:proton antiporter [Arthrobacter sp. Sa2CUA1]|uniref:Sodium:proton antiporter n=1 Tax=Arthrobacter gallicola TaxID=2762225 RepID=A0ABR8US70_9MICC|nr:sodium:proton antiporter [Arthrobacter gallicola]